MKILILKISDKTVLVNAGDALATVHPACGKGCNTALNTTPEIVSLVQAYDERTNESNDGTNVYQINQLYLIPALHSESKEKTSAIYDGLTKQEIIHDLLSNGWGIKKIARELGIRGCLQSEVLSIFRFF